MSIATRRGTWLTMLCLLALTVVTHVLIVANPGFFSHDEWQRADTVQAEGFASYAREYGAVKAGPDFGFPVRPIGFIQQGVSAQWMRDVPVATHGLDVLLHALAVILLWRALPLAGVADRSAILAAAVFAISPLATMATGWVGASFDRWFGTFLIVAASGALLVARKRGNAGGYALVLAGSAGAILSKETAVVLPGALLLMLWVVHAQLRDVRWRPALAAVSLACLPIVLFLWIRLPAIEATLAGHGGAYSPSASYIPSNALTYLAQPFLLRAVELVSASLLTNTEWAFALLAHAAVLGWLWWRFGLRMMAAYLAAYFIFLVPVIALPMKGAHYLYASGIPFAVALGLLLAPREARQGQSIRSFPAQGLLAVAIIGFLFARSQYMQAQLYQRGQCQSVLLTSFAALAKAATDDGATRLRIVGAPGAPEYVALGATFGRTDFSEGGRWPTVVGASAPAIAGERTFSMAEDCRVSTQ